MKKTFCQTKTGNKIHACGIGSSRSFCGNKIARKLYNMGLPNTHTVFCGGCGLNGEYILAMAQACKNMFAAFQK